MEIDCWWTRDAVPSMFSYLFGCLRSQLQHGNLTPQLGIKFSPPALQGRLLITGPPEISFHSDEVVLKCQWWWMHNFVNILKNTKLYTLKWTSLWHVKSIREKAMATHSSTLAWEIPWMEEPGRLQSMVAKSRTQLSNFTFTFHFHALEKETATHSSILPWRIPGTGTWWAAVYGATQSQTWLMQLSSSSSSSSKSIIF